MSNSNTAELKECGLQVMDLRFGYAPHAPVIDGYELNVPRGEVHCVLGVSGGGKTTLLRLIAGLERAQKGRILIDGQEYTGPGNHHPPERRPIGMVFQDYALFPNRNVLRNVLFGMSGGSRTQRHEEAQAILDRVGISSLADRMPHSLSGGQQQRVAIARALARKPRVMLLDEPFSSLDIDTRKETRAETINILRAAQVTTLMVTHDPGEAELVADAVSRIGTAPKQD